MGADFAFRSDCATLVATHRADGIITLADVVEITLRKLRRDHVPLPFSVEADAAAASARQARKLSRRSASGRLDETEGVLHQILGEYSI